MDGQNPVPWMAQRGVLPTDLPCKFCRSGRALLQPDASALNGYSLRCRAPGWVAGAGAPLSPLLSRWLAGSPHSGGGLSGAVWASVLLSSRVMMGRDHTPTFSALVISASTSLGTLWSLFL